MARLALALPLLVVCAVALVAAASDRYDGHVVLRLDLNTANGALTTEQHAAYFNLRSSWNLDWWSDSDVRVSPDRIADVRRFMNEHNLVHSVMIEDVQKLIGQEEAHRALVAAGNTSDLLKADGTAVPDFFKDYRPLDQIWAFVDQLVAQFPTLATKKQMGTSYEGRPIYTVVINSNKGAQSSVYFEGGIHSREWVSHTTVLYIMWSLLSQYGQQANVTALVDKYNFHINPAVNPDGYVYTWTKDRMWRKTRQPNKGSSCVGVDPNRNWMSHWCEQGASRDPCSDSYCGPNAFSESETKAVADYVKTIGKVSSFIDFHAYSQFWMQPYGWTAAHPKDFDNQKKAGLDAVAAIKKSSGLTYEEGTIYTIVYPASGSSADWAYDTAGVPYPYGVELRDTGAHGFILPAAQIVPCGEEILAAVSAMMAYISAH